MEHLIDTLRRGRMNTGSEVRKLSERQRNIIYFIMKFLDENKYPPTIREIGETVNISSTSVTNYNLTKLVEMGLVERQKEVSRGITLNFQRLHEYGISVDTDRTFNFPQSASSLIAIPVLGHIAAGQPIAVETIDPANAEDFVELTAELCRNRDQNRLFALRVKGDSMIDAGVLDGDIVILQHQETAEEGEMVAAWIEGDEETTLKHFHRRGKMIELRPANPSPEYKPIERPADRVRIKGKVVSVVRIYD